MFSVDSKYLQKEISIPLESVHMFSDQMVKNISRVVDDVRRLFLVERFVDSIKVSAWAYLWGFFGVQTPQTNPFLL